MLGNVDSVSLRTPLPTGMRMLAHMIGAGGGGISKIRGGQAALGKMGGVDALHKRRPADISQTNKQNTRHNQSLEASSDELLDGLVAL